MITIQRVYRGYRVRRQLNEDLVEICKKVGEVKEKISDKKSKYWISSEGKIRESSESDRKVKGSGRF